MNRTIKIFELENTELFFQKCILWSKQFTEVVALDSNDHSIPYNSLNKIIACDAITSIQTNDYIQIKEYQSHLRDWCFGFITYDVKNEIFNITSNNPTSLNFPEIVFFQPKRIITIKDNTVEFSYLIMCDDEISTDFQEINDSILELSFAAEPINLVGRVSEERYTNNFNKAIDYIKRGDTYELNYCIEFYNENAKLKPEVFYNHLNQTTKSSFSAFVSWQGLYAMCASPERYIKKIKDKLVSQPIKGTAKRGKTKEEDLKIINDLKNNPKERAENVMIVDLVRNDLSTIATKNSVQVEELCEIYSFSHVHQMISTISCHVDQTLSPIDILYQTFPMGSMTGVPKKRTLEIIDEIEDHKRELYSGTIGYISPNQEFDFNVVIRTLLYNSNNNYASLSVGSAVTFKANAEDEYNECLLKSMAIRNLLAKND